MDDQEVRFEVGVAIPEKTEVDRVELTLESALRSLRAACALYKVVQSGSKRKWFGRLVERQAHRPPSRPGI